MKSSKQPQSWLVGLVLVIGVLAISSSAIFIRLAIEAAEVRGLAFSLVLAASRLTVASLALVPAWKSLRSARFTFKAWGYAIAAGMFLALHFAMWITSLSYTSIVASVALVTTNPIWVALLSWLWLKEKPSRLTGLGIGVALLGGGAIAFGPDYTANASNPLFGNLLALLSAWAVSLYFLLGREAQREGMGIGSYITVAYSTATLILLPMPLLLGASYFGYPKQVYLYMILMGIVCQLVGHTSFNWAVHWISPTLVTLAILFEPIGASILGYLIFQEVPTMLVFGGGVFVLLGVAIAAMGDRPPQP